MLHHQTLNITCINIINIMYYNYTYEDYNEELLTFGYHGFFDFLNYKVGAMYSKNLGIMGTLGIGFSLY